MSTLYHEDKDIKMVKEFIDGFIVNLTYAIGIKSFKIKLLYFYALQMQVWVF